MTQTGTVCPIEYIDTYWCNQFKEAGDEIWYVLEITIRLLHVELFTEAQIAENVEDQVVDLIGHVERVRPLAVLALLCLLPEEFNPAAVDLPPLD